MDMHDFESADLYFDEPLHDEAQQCLVQASSQYGKKAAEDALMRAYFLAPEHPTVLVALYRYFYFQHRLDESLLVAERVLLIYAKRLGLPADWSQLTESTIGNGVMVSMTLIRFYLLALKGAGFLEMRLGRFKPAVARLSKVVELDTNNRLGAQALLELAQESLQARAVPA